MTMFVIILVTILMTIMVYCKISGDKETKEWNELMTKIMEMDDESFKRFYENNFL